MAKDEKSETATVPPLTELDFVLEQVDRDWWVKHKSGVMYRARENEVALWLHLQQAKRDLEELIR